MRLSDIFAVLNFHKQKAAAVQQAKVRLPSKGLVDVQIHKTQTPHPQQCYADLVTPVHLLLVRSLEALLRIEAGCWIFEILCLLSSSSIQACLVLDERANATTRPMELQWGVRLRSADPKANPSCR